MVRIICPDNNVPERKYSIDCVFRDLLGFGENEYKVLFNEYFDEFYQIEINEQIIKIEDHFFRFHKAPLSYLNSSNIPSVLHYFHAFDLSVPIIYGVDKFIQEENTIYIGLDIFASTFFMLTRWEENFLGREEKGDCDESQLFSVRHNIYKRPIVNEYEAILRKILTSCGISLQSRQFQVVLAHDVDGIITPSWSGIIKSLLKRILGKYRTSITVLSWRQQLIYKFKFPNCFSQFKFYRDICIKYNIQEWFYFKVCAKGEVESTYHYNDSELIKLVNYLKEENDTYLGFHPSQSTFNDIQRWNKEVNRISQLIGNGFIIGRNHHLLYNYQMLRLWENLALKSSLNNDFKISNCVFHKRLGFRSGVAVPYSIFDIYERRVMSLKEYPCQIMDTAIRLGRYVDDTAVADDINYIVNQCKTYSGHLILTWHIYIRKIELIKDYYNKCLYTIKATFNE